MEIIVEDTGIGIASEDIPELFKPFHQLENVYKKKYRGAGIGLYLCKQIVEAHGGSIWAESEFGKGSKFMFSIPLNRDSRPINT
jgi:signal transduction histidine kinase